MLAGAGALFGVFSGSGIEEWQLCFSSRGIKGSVFIHLLRSILPQIVFVNRLFIFYVEYNFNYARVGAARYTEVHLGYTFKNLKTILGRFLILKK